ncbi:MAG: hypothetical protein ACK5M0_03540 [Bacteroidales bacterium]
MISDNNPYEYYEDVLGVQAWFLFSSYKTKAAHPKSLCIIGYNALAQQISRKTINRLRKNAPGTPMLLEFASLPDRWQDMLVEAFGEPKGKIKETFFESQYEKDLDAYRYYSKLKVDGERLSNDKIDEYTLNASVMNTIGRVYRARVKERKRLKIGLMGTWQSVMEETEKFRLVQPHTIPCANEVYFARKYNKYKNEGYDSLLSGRLGNNNARVVDNDTEDFLNDLFISLKHKPSQTEVAELYEAFVDGYVEVINSETGEAYQPKEVKKISTSTVKSYLSKWENEIGTLSIRSADRQKLMAKFKPYHSLLQPSQANSIISVDDRQPVFEYAKGKRMWFYNAIDLGSEAFTCWVYGLSKQGLIIDFYRQLVRNYHGWGLSLPAEIEAESSLNSSFKNTFLKEGNMFEYVRIEANNARGKRIERYYGNLRYDYEKRHDGWLARPFALAERNQKNNEKTPIVPYDILVSQCLSDIEVWNNSEHSKIKGKSRWEVFMAMQNPNVRPTNYEAIIPYLGYETTTSCRTGIVRLNNEEFLLGSNGNIAFGDELIDYMCRIEGRSVSVRWLDDNEGRLLKAYVVSNGQAVCELVSKPVYSRASIEMTEQDLIKRELMSKYVATIEGYAKKSRERREKLLVVDNRPRTISNSFSIGGNFKRFEAINNDIEVEVLPAIETGFNYDLNAFENENRVALADRF